MTFQEVKHVVGMLTSRFKKSLLHFLGVSMCMWKVKRELKFTLSTDPTRRFIFQQEPGEAYKTFLQMRYA